MQLYFIRHGQSINNARWENDEYSSHDRESDPSLTEKGIRQAEKLALYLSQRKKQNPLESDRQNRDGFDLTHLYSSLMIRAIQTGTIVSETLGIPLVGLPEAHEVGGIYLEIMNGGVAEITHEHGVTPNYLHKKFPNMQLSKPIEDKGWWKGGREENDLPLKRAETVLQYIKERHLNSEDRVGIITHGGFFNYMMRVLLQISPEEPDNRKLSYWLSYCNCAISRFDLVNDRIIFVYHNHTDFLEDELVTC